MKEEVLMKYRMVNNPNLLKGIFYGKKKGVMI